MICLVNEKVTLRKLEAELTLSTHFPVVNDERRFWWHARGKKTRRAEECVALIQPNRAPWQGCDFDRENMPSCLPISQRFKSRWINLIFDGLTDREIPPWFYHVIATLLLLLYHIPLWYINYHMRSFTNFLMGLAGGTAETIWAFSHDDASSTGQSWIFS